MMILILALSMTLVHSEGISSERSKMLQADFDKYRSLGDVKKSVLVLEEISKIDGYKTPRDIFSMCRSIKRADCSVFKARVFESEGNAGSAMELYLRAGRTRDYTRLKALSGQDISKELESSQLSSIDKNYYQGLSAFSKGKWEQVVPFFTSEAVRQIAGVKLMLFLSYLMLGELSKAKALQAQTGDLVDDMKMKAMMLYAENKQYDAMRIFKEILKYSPKDPLVLKYLAHVYYRTGWFKQAEDIYDDLISVEWRDTELYYLLSERVEMRVRYLMPEKTFKDVERIIREYPDRPDFIVQYISWLLEYGYSDIAGRYLNKIPLDKGAYTGSLRYFAEGLIFEYGSMYKDAQAMFNKAYELYPVMEYKNRIEAIRVSDRMVSRNKRPPTPDCRSYKLSRMSEGWYLVTGKGNGQQWPVKFYARITGDDVDLMLRIRFVHDAEMAFGDKGTKWSDSISATWSTGTMKLRTIQVKEKELGSIDVEVVPWPSSFYLKRASSHEWSILTPYRVIDHEAGHLLGLFDEYYEMDTRLSTRNSDRYIGEPVSIMRNMLSGTPQKRHIQFILSSLKCLK